MADAYDAMTSRRSYRETLPQQKVREELVNAMGSQLDPKYAKIMLDLMDQDREYSMQEQTSQVPPDRDQRSGQRQDQEGSLHQERA